MNPTPIEIIPGILEKDWPAVSARLELVNGVVRWVQIDVADNTLVPNETLLDFSQFSSFTSTLSFEAHLMVAEPEKYIKPLADAGFGRLIAHVEAHDPRRFLEQAKYEDVEVGIAIDGETPIEQVEPFLEEVDMVLVMTIQAGFSGQEFMTETVEKIKAMHEHFPDLAIEVDGGINEKTAKVVKEAGATRLVSTSFLFKDVHAIPAAIDALKNA